MDPELIKRFDSIDDHLKNADTRFDRIDARFETVEKRFDGIDARFENVEERLDKLNARMVTAESRFEEFKDFAVEHMVTKAELDERLANLPTKEDFQNLSSLIDGYSKQVTDFNQEKIILGERTSQIEEWVQKAAPKVGVEYKP